MFDELKLFAKLFFVITVLFTVCLYLFSLILEPALFYFTAEGISTSNLQITQLPMYFLNITVIIPTKISVGTVFLFLWVATVLSFAAAWKIRGNFHKVIKETVTRPFEKLFRSSLFTVPIICSMALIGVIVIQSLQESAGIPTGTSPLPSDPFQSLLGLAYASVVEELDFRIIPIGILIIIYLWAIRRKSPTLPSVNRVKLFFTAFLFPDKAKKMVNTKTVEQHGILHGISISEWAMVAFTTAVFGLAHFDPGTSWEIGKVTSAAFAGLIIALCYMVYGAHAAIIIHWFFNVYPESYNLLSDYYPSFSPISNTIWLLTLVLGLIGWLMALVLWLRKLTRYMDERRNQTTLNLTIYPE